MKYDVRQACLYYGYDIKDKIVLCRECHKRILINSSVIDKMKAHWQLHVNQWDKEVLNIIRIK